MSEPNLFRVEDMTCGHCAKSVKAALADALPGVEVSVDVVSHEVRVAGDAAKAEAAIREAGYTPERIGA